MEYDMFNLVKQAIFVRNKENTPLLIMMCGLPGSGKSRYANLIHITNPFVDKYFEKPVIHSSDKLREEMFGNEETQGDNNKLFRELHKRIKNDLLSGKDVVYDATNIKKKERIQFLSEVKNIKCFPICVVMATEYEACLYNNDQRDRVVPIEVIERMHKNWTPPHYNEGFKYIHYVFSYLYGEKVIDNKPKYKYCLDYFFSIANDFDQKNHHHKLSLGEHCTKTATYIQEHFPNNFNLLYAAMLHDEGKLHSQTETNAKGINDGDCHYYQHHCVGAYNSLFYMHRAGMFSTDDMVYISNLIYYHMHPYLQWRQSEKVLKRDKELIGEKLYNDIMVLHQADLEAH